MNMVSLRHMKPLTLDERKSNAERNRKAREEFKQVSKEIKEFCQARGLAEPQLLA